MQRIQSRLPGFKSAKVTVAIHADWAIEGAIGSDRKLDAAYVSPTLHIRKCLVGMARDYGVQVLATERFVSQLAQDLIPLLRRVDVVRFTDADVHHGTDSFMLSNGSGSGSGGGETKSPGGASAISVGLASGGGGAGGGGFPGSEPASPLTPKSGAGSSRGGGGEKRETKLGLYTFDTIVDSKLERERTPPVQAGQRFERITKSADRWLQEAQGLSFTAARSFFENDADFAALRAGVKPDFLRAWADAMSLYEAGSWDKAPEALDQAAKLAPVAVSALAGLPGLSEDKSTDGDKDQAPKDGPTRFLQDYMQAQRKEDGGAPVGWNGSRLAFAQR